MGWIGNIFIIFGLWFVGNKKRWAFILSVIGEVCWIIHSLLIQMYDLAIICVVFALLAARSWYKWGKEERPPSKPKPFRYVPNKFYERI